MGQNDMRPAPSGSALGSGARGRGADERSPLSFFFFGHVALSIAPSIPRAWAHPSEFVTLGLTVLVASECALDRSIDLDRSNPKHPRAAGAGAVAPCGRLARCGQLKLHSLSPPPPPPISLYAHSRRSMGPGCIGSGRMADFHRREGGGRVYVPATQRVRRQHPCARSFVLTPLEYQPPRNQQWPCSARPLWPSWPSSAWRPPKLVRLHTGDFRLHGMKGETQTILFVPPHGRHHETAPGQNGAPRDPVQEGPADQGVRVLRAGGQSIVCDLTWSWNVWRPSSN